MAAQAPVLLTCERLVVGHRPPGLLPPIDLQIRAGEFWAVIGRNGAGKSTWFKTVLGLNRPVSGRVVFAKDDVRLCYVPQRLGLDDLHPMRARDVVAQGTYRKWSFLHPAHWFEPPEVLRALGEVGAAELGDRLFRELSEGQKQRVLLARMLASHGELALLDEPTAAMDVVAEREAFTMLAELNKNYGITIVVVSHYLGVAREFAGRVLFLDRDGASIVVGTPEDVFADARFRERYGAAGEAPR